MAQVALNWCTSRTNVIVIPKPNSVTRTEELYRTGWRLSPIQVRTMDFGLWTKSSPSEHAWSIPYHQVDKPLGAR